MDLTLAVWRTPFYESLDDESLDDESLKKEEGYLGEMERDKPQDKRLSLPVFSGESGSFLSMPFSFFIHSFQIKETLQTIHSLQMPVANSAIVIEERDVSAKTLQTLHKQPGKRF